MGFRWLIVLLLSVALVGALAARTTLALAMDAPFGALSQQHCDPDRLPSADGALPMACAKGPACVAMQGVQPPIMQIAEPPPTAAASLDWGKRVGSGLDVPPEIGPPKRIG